MINISYKISINYCSINPINGFRPAATHPSRRFCSLLAYASWLHQSMTGLPRFGLSNGCKVVLFADFRRSPHQIPVSPEHPLLTNDMAEPARPLNIIVEELIHLTIESNAEIIANSDWTEDLTWAFSLEYSQGRCISA